MILIHFSALGCGILILSIRNFLSVDVYRSFTNFKLFKLKFRSQLTKAFDKVSCKKMFLVNF